MIVVLFVLVPVGGIVAVVLGWRALRSTRKTPQIRTRHLKLKELP
jgi:hypothetical protein